MTNLAIFTASTSNKQAYAHFVKTIANSYDFSKSSHLTSGQLKILNDLYPSRKAEFWGSRPGRKNQWKKLRPGDIVLIYQDGYFIYSAIIKYCFHNPKFAEEVWGKIKKQEKSGSMSTF